MEIRWHKKVWKSFLNETIEIKEDIDEILEWLILGYKIGLPHVRPLAEIQLGLYEIRVKDRYGHFRLIYYLKSREVIHVIHSFRKKTNRISMLDIELIKIRIREIQNV